ncbi:hypothetical protein EGJ23_00620 [Pseudomonas sp. o96-267]|nr:hypothetical protein EGJ23_00620 [Pseudomonas sp. o96-267]
MDGQRPFFLSARPKPDSGRALPGGRGRKAARWADVYACLIRAGYGDVERIGRYTERQILLFFEAEKRQRRTERAEMLKDMNLAFAGGEAADKHFKELLP